MPAADLFPPLATSQSGAHDFKSAACFWHRCQNFEANWATRQAHSACAPTPPSKTTSPKWRFDFAPALSFGTVAKRWQPDATAKQTAPPPPNALQVQKPTSGPGRVRMFRPWCIQKYSFFRRLPKWEAPPKWGAARWQCFLAFLISLREFGFSRRWS